MVILTGVFIVADEDDKKMWRTLPGILSRNFCVKDKSVDGLKTNSPDLFIGKLLDRNLELVAQAVYIFKNAAPEPYDIPLDVKSVAIVDSSAGASLLESVSRTQLPAITCGLSPRDTLTLSSFGTDSAAVTLQRSIRCFDGTVAEPQEIPLRLDAPIDSFTLMAAAAVFILTGNFERLPQADFSVMQYK